MAVLDNGNTRRGPRLTIEMALWIAVAVLALVLRLVNLGAAPLAAHEAREAMLAWRAVTGQGMPGVGYSPFIFIADATLFALCGASDALARLWPALLGSMFVLTPLLFRHRVGRVAVLTAGVYLAISPTALFASRQLDGAVVAALGGAVLLGGGLRFLETGSRNWLVLAAVGLALAVTSGPSIYEMMLALGLAWLLFVWAWPTGKLRWLGGLLRPHLGVVFATFILAAFVFATGLGWNLPGVGAAADLFPAWFARLGEPSLLPLANFVLYEPLALLVALAGLMLTALFKLVCLVQRWLVRQKHHIGVLLRLARLAQRWLVCWERRIGMLLGLWVGLGSCVLIAVPPQRPVEGVWLVLPLALLGGLAVEAVVQKNRRAVKEWRAEWVYVFVTSALWIYLYLRFSRYGLEGDPLDLVVGIMALAFPLLLLALVALVFALVSGDDRVVTEEILKGARSALHGAVLSTTAVLLAITLSTGWGITHVRPADPRELLVYEPSAIEVHDLVQILRDLSWRETGLPTTLEFTYEAASDSVLAWYLRDFSAARRVDDLRGAGLGERGAVVVTSDREWATDALDGTELLGQDFALSRNWSLSTVSCVWEWPPCNEAIEWLIRRDPTPTDRTGEWAALVPEVTQWAAIWTYGSAEETSHSH
ncbi:MAG: hypothetical protein JXA14_22005 [Anaerolineae bacterium]|nr:hypothetical protein [Anaerolineae bacterium]